MIYTKDLSFCALGLTEIKVTQLGARLFCSTLVATLGENYLDG